MNPLPTLTAPCPHIFLLNLSNTEDVALVANIGKASLAKRTDNQTFNRKFTRLNYFRYLIVTNF